MTMRKLLTLIISGLIVLTPSTAQASWPLYTEDTLSQEYEAYNYWWASWILDWYVFETLFLNYNYDYLNNDTEEVIPEPEPFFYPKAVATNGTATAEPVYPTYAASTDRCSQNCVGATGSIGFAPGEVGYNDGVKVISHDPSTGRIYETLNWEKVNSNYYAWGCDSSPTAACFTK